MSKGRPGKRIVICSAFLLLQWSACAWASGHAGDVRDLTSIPLESLLNMEVQSASRFKQNISEAPSAVSVITASDIKIFSWRTLSEILNSLPGIHTTNDRTYTSVGARGFLRAGDYNIRFLLLIDGHRVNDPLYDQAMMGQEFMLDVDLIDRVEYVPGTGSAVYGSNAFFGVINVITKRGRDFKGGQVSVEGGSAGMHRERATIGSQNENGVEWLLSATNYNRDGKNLTFPEFPGQVARGLDYEKVQSVFAKGSAGPFSISLAHAERKKGIPTANYGQDFNDPRSGLVDTMSFLNIGYATSLNAHLLFSSKLLRLARTVR